jgi:hypothetical protein
MNEKAEKEGIIKSNYLHWYNFYSINLREFEDSKWDSRLGLRVEDNHYSLIRDWLLNLIVK